MIRTIIVSAMLVLAAIAADVSAEPKKAAAAADTAHIDKKKAAAVDTAHVDKKKAVAVDTVHTDTVAAAAVVDTVSAAGTEAAIDTIIIADLIKTDNFSSHKREREWLLSARNDLIIVLGEISSVGLILEAGMIDENGYLLSLDVGGGANYWGVGLNAGYVFKGYGNSVHAVGVSGNFHHTELVVHVKSKRGAAISTEYGVNRAFAGAFWKMIPWETGNLDITNRFLFGYKRDSAWWDDDNAEIEYKKGFSVTYSFTVGYTLMKRSK